MPYRYHYYGINSVNERSGRTQRDERIHIRLKREKLFETARKIGEVNYDNGKRYNRLND